MNYCFIREAAGEDCSVVLVVKDRRTKLILAQVVLLKGGDTEWVSEQVCREFSGIRGNVVFKTDQEPALVDLVDKICAPRPSSGSCLTHSERAVQSLDKVVRLHKLTFESHLKTRLARVHLIMTWLVEHCADVLNRYNIGADGRIPQKACWSLGVQ